MRFGNIYIILFGFSLICAADCKRIYNPPALQNNPRMLVIDGFLTNTPDSTYITITRSRNISDSMPSPMESSANVMVEAENAADMPLREISPGIYGGLLSLDSTQKYRLVIRTIGTIFDAQPTQVNSNIHCIDNPSEPVLGYLCASSTTKKKNFYQQGQTFSITTKHRIGFPVSLTRMS